MLNSSIKTRLSMGLGLIIMAGFLAVASLNYYSLSAVLDKDFGYGNQYGFSDENPAETLGARGDRQAMRPLLQSFYLTLLTGLIVTGLVIIVNLMVISRFQDRLETMATTDDLTGMPNRRAFFCQAQRDVAQAGRYKTPISLLIIDVDHFKGVNDKLGHETADLVLKDLADRIRMTVRENDLTGRIDGEEFAVILPQTDLESACAAARRLQQAVASSRLTASGFGLDITLSVGAACRENAYTDLNELMRIAGLALYEAKKQGGNLVCTAYEKS